MQPGRLFEPHIAACKYISVMVMTMFVLQHLKWHFPTFRFRLSLTQLTLIAGSEAYVNTPAQISAKMFSSAHSSA